MYLNGVTISGIDETVSVQGLLDLKLEFPFIEFGVLLKDQVNGKNARYPAFDWIQQLPTELTLAGHICGKKWVGDLVSSGVLHYSDLDSVWDKFSRIQINCFNYKHAMSEKKFGLALLDDKFKDKEIIIQADRTFDNFLHFLQELEVNFSAFYDTSTGMGATPNSWCVPLENIKCGYGGGLGPDNVLLELSKIKLVTDGPIWIDCETNIRTDNKFDLKKCKNYLNIVKQFVEFINDPENAKILA